MAIVFMDSFDHYTSASEKGWGLGTAGGGPQASIFRNGGQSMLVQATGNGRRGRNLPTDYTTLVFGFAHYSSGTAFNGSTFFRIEENGTLHLSFNIQSTGRIRALHGSGSTLGNGTAVLAGNTWYYIEIKATINDSTGVVVVRVNGITDINLSSQDTRNGATGVINQMQFEQGPGGAYFDDLYILDTTGSAPNNDFLGDIRVEALFPNGNGNSSQFDGSDGNQTDNYLLVDEAAPNSDTDYVESPDVGDKDTYAYTNLTPTTGTVHAIQPALYAKKSDAGSRAVASVARHSGSETDGPNQQLLATYSYLTDVRETKPGGGAWSISDVNAAEFGVKVTV